MPYASNVIYFTTVTHGYKLATRLSCLVEINMQYFWFGKTIEIFSLDEKKHNPTHAGR